MSDIIESPIRIVIFDSNLLIRAGLRLLIESHPRLEVVGETGNSDEGLEMVAHRRPDIILLDLNLSGESGLCVISKFINSHPGVKIILLADPSDSVLYLQAVEEGVVGVVFNNQRPEILVKAITKVYAGEVWLERSMIANVLSRMSRSSQPIQIDPDLERIKLLSDREKQIILLIGEGLKNKQIALRLCISETTVRHHLTSIFSKLEVSDRLELLIFAHRLGLAKLPGS